MADIFISHSSKDVQLADALVQLIEGGIGIRSDQIFCTSLEDQGIPPGVDFKTHIQKQLGDAKVVVAMVSPQYYASAFCMCELGATWALVKEFVPLLVPPIAYQDLRGTLFGSQVLPIDQDIKLDSMHAVLVKLAFKQEKVSRWNSRKKQFLESLPELLRKLPPVETLPAKAAEKLTAERDSYKQDFERADLEVVTLKNQISELEKVKDAEAVREITRKYTNHDEQFETLLTDARDRLSGLPRIVRYALYYSCQSKEFVPEDPDDWTDANGAIEDKLLNGNGHSLWPNDNHPKVHRAEEAIKRLSDFVNEPPEKFAQEYEDQHDDLFDITSRPFWWRHKLF